jgi:hypothetical protein
MQAASLLPNVGQAHRRSASVCCPTLVGADHAGQDGPERRAGGLGPLVAARDEHQEAATRI